MCGCVGAAEASSGSRSVFRWSHPADVLGIRSLKLQSGVTEVAGGHLGEAMDGDPPHLHTHKERLTSRNVQKPSPLCSVRPKISK